MAMTNSKYVHEVIKMAAEAKTRTEKIEILRKYESWPLKDILRGSFDDSIVWLLPPGDPPYTPADAHRHPSSFVKQTQNLKYFAKGGPGEKLLPLKRETMFIRMIESIHPEDAVLVLSMVNKKAPAKTITKKLVEEAFPNLIKK
jgi:hypothetical protein